MKTSFFAFILLLSCLSCSSTQKVDRRLSSYNETSLQAKMLETINTYRISNGLKSLKTNSILLEAAQQHALYLQKQSVLSHDEPAPGESPMKRVLNKGGDFETVAENVACGSNDPLTTLNDWIGSPDHKRNLLLPEIQWIGIGYVPPATAEAVCPHMWVTVFSGNP